MHRCWISASFSSASSRACPLSIPYFFWYFDGADWFDAYDEQDYALFDAGPGGGGESDDGALAVGEAWEGS